MMEQNKTECATGKARDMSIQRDRLGQKELITRKSNDDGIKESSIVGWNRMN